MKVLSESKTVYFVICSKCGYKVVNYNNEETALYYVERIHKFKTKDEKDYCSICYNKLFDEL